MNENRGGLAAYVTSHGFGHLNRTVSVLNQIPHDIPLVIRGHRDLFSQWRERLTRPARLEDHISDSGAVNPAGDSAATDGPATLALAQRVYAEAINHLPVETERLRDEHTAAVLADAPPIPLAAAAQAHIPAFALANFTWSEIYAEYAQTPDTRHFVNQLDTLYQQATAVFRAEPALPMRVFRRQIEVGLVGSVGNNRNAELRAQFSIPAHHRLVYLYVGRYGQGDLHWHRLAEFPHVHFIALQPSPLASLTNVHTVSPFEWTGADLQASTDASLAKAGYGAVCEAMLARRPLIYPPRTGFAEHATLEHALTQWGAGIPLSTDQFQSLDIAHALQQAFNLTPAPPPYPTDGAARIAAHLTQVCRTKQGLPPR